MLREEINKHSDMVLFCVRENKLLLRHVRDAKIWNDDGVVLTQELFEPTGGRKLKSEVAFQLRHILFTFPKIAITRLPKLLSIFLVILGGREPRMGELPSVATIRSNATRLNNLDTVALGRMFSNLAKELLP